VGAGNGAGTCSVIVTTGIGFSCEVHPARAAAEIIAAITILFILNTFLCIYTLS
jgi:hypothetical protein